MYDVTIIGAGVVGGMLARTLAKYDLKLCILEREGDVAMGATKANSAIVHAGFDAKTGTLKARLNVRGCQMMPTVCEELGVPYKNCGALVVAFTEEERETLAALLERGTQNGVEGLRIVEHDELIALEPNLSDEVLCALLAPTGGIVCPYSLAIAAIGNAMDNGADLKLNFTVKRIEETAFGYRVFSESEMVESRFVVNCAGLHADDVARMVGDTSFSVHPRRGEYILLDTECGSLFSHTIFRTPTKLGKGILITPTVHGNLLLGPTATDTDNKTARDTTAKGISEILESTRKTARHLPANLTITSFAGLRAVGSAGDFILTVPRKHFVQAAGIESPGLASSPAIAEHIEHLLQGEGLNLTPKRDYVARRAPYHAFSHASPEEKNRVIQQNPAYGKIVCRCEKITEGEILDAISRNPRPHDADGVKRRTRAQMGRCQGGFCGPVITELLAKAQGIPLTEVTKSGHGSALLFEHTKGSRNV